jgi:hypothetical protein
MSGPRVGAAAGRDDVRNRDRELVRQVAELRLMSGRQIEATHFPPGAYASSETASRRCRQVLARLVRDGRLHRLDRRVGGVRAGSSSFVYALGAVGHRLIEDDRVRSRRYEPSAVFVKHQLAVSQLVVELILAAQRGEIELLRVEGEPSCWRNVPAVGRVVLRPDLSLVLSSDELEYRWFVEVDRDTHHRPAILRKARLYESYYRTGVEQANSGVFPRVIWITPTATRGAALRNTLDSGKFTAGLMVVTAVDEAVAVLTGRTA